MTNFRLFQTERACRRPFEFNENGREFSKRVGNIVEKGEIAHFEQFLLFPVFSKDLYSRQIKTRVCIHQPFLSHILQICPHIAAFECNTISVAFTYKILENRTKNVLENVW